MRLGCVGCLLLVVAVLAVLALAVGALFLSVNVFEAPDSQPVPFSRGDGFAAQQKLYEVVLRQAGRSSRRDPIILSEREANAFLGRHLTEAAGLMLSPLTVRFTKGQVFVQGQTPLRNLLHGPPFAQLLPYLPQSRLEQPVWVTARGRIDLEHGSAAGGPRYGTVTLSELTLGKQPVASFMVYVMMGPAASRLLRWQVPAVVTAIEVEDRQLVIRTGQ